MAIYAAEHGPRRMRTVHQHPATLLAEDNSRDDFCISSVYDVLEEKFIENGDQESLPANEQTLRNYVHYL